MEASLCQVGGMGGDRLDKGLSGRERARQWGGLGCERRRRQALGSGLEDRAPAGPGAGTGSGEGGSPSGEEGWTLETRDGQGLSVYGWPAPGESYQNPIKKNNIIGNQCTMGKLKKKIDFLFLREIILILRDNVQLSFALIPAVKIAKLYFSDFNTTFLVVWGCC